MVWHNPLNDPKKGKDIEANLSKLKGEVSLFGDFDSHTLCVFTVPFLFITTNTKPGGSETDGSDGVVH